MKLLSIIFFISAVLSAVISVLAFLGLIPGKGSRTGIALIVSSALFGLCELACIWEAPVGVIIIIPCLIVIQLIFTVIKDKGDEK